MSYRSLKALLGETNLERKCLFLFGVCLFFLIAGSFWWYGKLTEKQVYLASQRTGRGLVDSIMLRHHYQKLETIEMTKDLEGLLGPDLGNQEYSWTLIKPQPAESDKPEDEFEWGILKKFLQTPPPESAAASGIPEFDERLVPAKAEYDYYQPVRARRGAAFFAIIRCAAAAGLPEFKEGDLMAIIRVVLPDGENIDAISWNRAILIATAIITVFLAMVSSYVIIRYVIVKPLRHLRDISDEISRGNMALRAELHTGDEFEDLAVAFNRMLRHLTTIQQELRHVNGDLDVKVDQLRRPTCGCTK